MITLPSRALQKLQRRRFLRGAGGAAIALPLLQTAGGSLQAQVGAVPDRFIGLFVAQGLPKVITDSFLDYVHPSGSQPLRSLVPFKDRLTMVRGLSVLTEHSNPKTPHSNGCASFMCGMDCTSRETKGGPTLDWIFKQEKAPNTILPTINTGVWGADDSDEFYRIVHSWRGVNQPNDPIADTKDLFKSVFGNMPNLDDPAAKKEQLYRKSVLDPVMEDYKFAMSDASGYSAGVRTLISNHLDTVRELEKKIGSLGSTKCVLPTEPASIEGSGKFPPIVENWPMIRDIVSDLFIMAYRCDLVRSGTFMVDSGGDKWPYQGKHGSTDNVHGTTLHNWKSDSHAPLAYEIFEWYWDKAGDFLTRLDDPNFVDVDGATLLSNTTVMIGTELGDPGHNLNDFTFMIAGGNKPFQRGAHTFQGKTDVDFYNTLLTGLGIDKRIGEQKYFGGNLGFL
ncbi:MAG: hypothetical protein RJA70_1442 [Pseudomonadota bacterium]|jgi:hypothetical protein